MQKRTLFLLSILLTSIVPFLQHTSADNSSPETPLPMVGNTVTDTITEGTSLYYLFSAETGNLTIILSVPTDADFDLLLYDTEFIDTPMGQIGQSLTDGVGVEELIYYDMPSNFDVTIEVSAFLGSGEFTLTVYNNETGGADPDPEPSVEFMETNTVTATISTEGASLLYIFPALSGNLTITLEVPATGDFDLVLYDTDNIDTPQGQLATSFNNGVGVNELIYFDMPSSFNVTIEVVSFSGTGEFTLTVYNSNITIEPPVTYTEYKLEHGLTSVLDIEAGSTVYFNFTDAKTTIDTYFLIIYGFKDFRYSQVHADYSLYDNISLVKGVEHTYIVELTQGQLLRFAVTDLSGEGFQMYTAISQLVDYTLSTETSASGTYASKEMQFFLADMTESNYGADEIVELTLVPSIGEPTLSLYEYNIQTKSVKYLNSSVSVYDQTLDRNVYKASFTNNLTYSLLIQVYAGETGASFTLSNQEVMDPPLPFNGIELFPGENKGGFLNTTKRSETWFLDTRDMTANSVKFEINLENNWIFRMFFYEIYSNGTASNQIFAQYTGNPQTTYIFIDVSKMAGVKIYVDPFPTLTDEQIVQSYSITVTVEDLKSETVKYTMDTVVGDIYYSYETTVVDISNNRPGRLNVEIDSKVDASFRMNLGSCNAFTVFNTTVYDVTEGNKILYTSGILICDPRNELGNYDVYYPLIAFENGHKYLFVLDFFTSGNILRIDSQLGNPTSPSATGGNNPDVFIYRTYFDLTIKSFNITFGSTLEEFEIIVIINGNEQKFTNEGGMISQSDFINRVEVIIIFKNTGSDVGQFTWSVSSIAKEIPSGTSTDTPFPFAFFVFALIPAMFFRKRKLA
ncbi:MAG: hypothetical protein INQ03_20035 [Candidatus Heimdallarchaeota archaeon]|nr:hypothetical protein [Candidatus Heimdallarchaeota archaeon]